jgi:sulfoxide reductase heme-binding subunit YedZ
MEGRQGLSQRWVNRTKVLLFIVCLIPLLQIGLQLSDSVNPIEMITRATGTWALVGLLVTLAVSPLRQILGLSWLLSLRRMLGLFAFFYALLHFITYIWLDQFFDLAAMTKDIFQRPFIMVGFLAFVLLIPLAITSTNGWMRRLKRNWGRLHRLIYVIAVLAVIHYLWLVKKDLTEPLMYAGVLALLLGWRLWRRKMA